MTNVASSWALNVQKSKVKKKNNNWLPQLYQKSSFIKVLCFALLSANIPLNKSSNKSFRTFLEVYTRNNVPTETNLRLGYIDDIIFDEIPNE
ncbi:unnamed protein product [Macrosiphum euphorbiae]|uniref:Uncharacterized protein n=1 Tax=Macrosiphum euphorbiae TaxID=13131 RepID=A0AAV0WZT5_9HEMI|nr:unnamed protein product [Macrosiphum euphorbiae]